MSSRRRRGPSARFLLAQLMVVAVSVLAAAVAAALTGPPLFHEHLLRAGTAPDGSELYHVERAYRHASLRKLGAALLPALLGALLVTGSFTRRLRRPLAELTRAARDMAGGRYGTRVPPMDGGAEVDALAESFNTMAAELERTEDLRRRMLSDLPHELRTPVAVLALYLEGLEDGLAEFDAATGGVMAEQLARLTRLVEDIDDVSRAEEGRMVLERSPVPVGELLRSAAGAAREAYTAKGVGLRLENGPASTTVVDVDRQRRGQVLGNLLSNALRHTPPDGRVVLGAASGPGGDVVLRVADTGEGTAPEHLHHVFERFYRGDTARDRDHGGSGIGLTIPRVLVEAHGGTLSATSPGPGSGPHRGTARPSGHRVLTRHGGRMRRPPLALYPRGVYTCGRRAVPPPHRISSKEPSMTTGIRRPLPMAATGCACCAPADGAARNTAAPTVQDAPAATTATYQVEGMTCGHCAGAVTASLTALRGVRDVAIDLVAGGTSAVTVTADPAVSAAAVRAAIEDAGYTLATS